MENICQQCQGEYKVSASDKVFYKKIEVPEPKCCPQCRQQRRFAYRNEWGLHKANCSKCKRDMISMFDPTYGYNVLCPECWWADDFDPLAYGVDYDFSRPFFQQMDELLKRCPLPNLVIGECENSDYTNFAWRLKNCYLVAASDYSEDCMYCTYAVRSQDCVDCTFVNDCELCYQALDCKKCYGCSYVQNCQDSKFCSFCFDCAGCEDCLGCTGLRRKKYHIFNKEYSQEEYEKKKVEFLENNKDIEKLREQFEEFKLQIPHKFASVVNCEGSTGDHLIGCKNCEECFDMVESEDCKYSAFSLGSSDCMDCTGITPCELGYESCAVPENYFIKFCNVIWPKSSYLEYCFLARSSNHCFGCASLLKNEYCILNKQYTKEEYEEIIPKIKAHMEETGEYGEFFPLEICPFNYNESLVNDYYPMTKEDVLDNGGKWFKEMEQIDTSGEDVVVCRVSGKPFKMNQKELRFYKKMKIPLPNRAPIQRHRDRVALRNPRQIWDRKCDECGIDIRSSYGKERKEKVCCEECYLKDLN